ncbi:MAG: hypothetical protein ACK4HN_08210 [Thermosynechococcus sp.]|uniref:hypothetical protein n=1 Tax=Thermosynechococcus sp. TaxID=2814275 RepID=UPI00391CF459
MSERQWDPVWEDFPLTQRNHPWKQTPAKVLAKPQRQPMNGKLGQIRHGALG